MVWWVLRETRGLSAKGMGWEVNFMLRIELYSLTKVNRKDPGPNIITTCWTPSASGGSNCQIYTCRTPSASGWSSVYKYDTELHPDAEGVLHMYIWRAEQPDAEGVLHVVMKKPGVLSVYLGQRIKLNHQHKVSFPYPRPIGPLSPSKPCARLLWQRHFCWLHYGLEILIRANCKFIEFWLNSQYF